MVGGEIVDREERQRIIRDLAGKSFLRHEVKIPGRAYESDMKRQVLDRIFEVWSENPDMRLGQLLMIACGDRDLFYVEDHHLADIAEEHYEHRKTL